MAGGRRSILGGRRALVVGGSGGIGRAVAIELASRGASLLVQGRTPAKVDEVVRLVVEGGGRAQGLSCDIDDPEPFLEELGGYGIFDILVVAFGPFVRKSLAAHTPSDWRRMALLDLALPGALASRFFPAMCDRGFGRILLLGGTRTDAIRGYTTNAAYAAAKTGMGVLAKSIAIEGSAHNVAAVAVCPGLVRTEYIGSDEADPLVLMAPGGRLTEPAEVASIALDLLDGDPCVASGAVVSLDSGFSP